MNKSKIKELNWEKEWEEKVKELYSDMDFTDGETKVHDFGYRYFDAHCNEYFTITGFGNIKTFIHSLIQSTRKEVMASVMVKIRARRRVLKELYKKFTLDVDEHRLDELYQFEKSLTELSKQSIK